MYMKIGDIKLMHVKIYRGEELLFDGMVEEAPEELRETNYEAATFESGYIIIKVA